MHGALAEIERAAAGRGARWLVGERMTQADITASCVFTFLSDALEAGSAGAYPSLSALTERCERLPEFRAAKLAFAAPSRPS
jgi:glutathione S-transferase